LIKVVEKFVGELKNQLSLKKIVLEVTDQTLHWLFKKGHNPAYGARPYTRTVDEELKNPLVDDILFGKLTKGGKVKVSVKNKSLNFSISDEK